MRGPSNALGQVESSDAHDGHVTRLVSLRSAGLCKCLGSESLRGTAHVVGLRNKNSLRGEKKSPFEGRTSGLGVRSRKHYQLSYV